MINIKGGEGGRKIRTQLCLSHPAGQAVSIPGMQEGLSEIVANSELDVHAQGCMCVELGECRKGTQGSG